MKALKKLTAAMSILMGVSSVQASDLCPNRFPDFINDVCWSCMFPIRVSKAKITGRSIEDFDTAANKTLICGCLSSLKIGTPISFWEMSYMIDVHTQPGCLPTLGGLKLPVSWVDEQYGAVHHDANRTSMAFMNTAYYVSPMMYLLGAVLDDTCSDRSPFDVGWASEFDPTWSDEELALIKMPISFAFGSIPAIMAGGVDAAAAAVGFPTNEIFWQAGSWGPIYPLTGSVNTYHSREQMSRLVTTKMLAEAHAMREMAGLFSKGAGRSYACEDGELGCDSATSRAAMCAGSPSDMPPQLIMKKRQYKLQRLFPTPQTQKLGNAGCCSPIGRTTILQEVGTELPTAGYKDFGYAVFRRRDCCAGIVTPATVQ